MRKLFLIQLAVVINGFVALIMLIFSFIKYIKHDIFEFYWLIPIGIILLLIIAAIIYLNKLSSKKSNTDFLK